MESDQTYDYIVVGGGIEGSSTALYLARNGKRTLLLEQFALGHNRGSSHGASRIIRYSYRENYFTSLMKYAYEEWKKIEKESGNSIYVRTGLLIVEKNPGNIISEIADTLDKNGSEYENITAPKLKERYPQIQFDDNYKGLSDPEGGVLKADIGLSSIQQLFKKNGGIIKDNTTVKNIIPGDKVTVETSKGNFSGPNVVLCVGAWSGSLLKTTLALELPLTVQLIYVYYWEEINKGTYSYTSFPTFIDENTLEFPIFSLPSLEYPGMVKLCYEYGAVCDPDACDRTTDIMALPQLKAYVRHHFPGLKPEPSITDSCLYTMTPDHAFILDRHPLHRNIIIGAGFSGTGFKMGPVVGQILGDLAIGNQPKFNIEPFAFKRFRDE